MDKVSLSRRSSMVVEMVEGKGELEARRSWGEEGEGTLEGGSQETQEVERF